VFYLSTSIENDKTKTEIDITRSELEMFFDYSLDMLVLVGFDGCFKQVSPSFERILGWKKVEVISRSCLDFVHPDDNKSSLAEVKAHKSGTAAFQFENRYRHEDGSYRWISWNSHSISEKQIVVSIGRDITKRKQVEEALRKSEEQYSSLFSNMTSGFAYCKMIFDENRTPVDFIYLQINDAFERITGLKREVVVGRKVTEAIPEIKESTPELFTIYGRVAETGRGEKFEIFFKPLTIWLSISVYSPEKSYFAAVFEDITEHKKVEAAQKASQDHLKMAQRIAHLGSWEFNVKKDEALWSEELFHIFGLEPQRYGPNTENYRKFIHPDDDKAVNQIMIKLFNEGQIGDIVSFDYRIALSDAKQLTLHMSV
jgi:PAS domain S-box-containing protein